MTRDEFVQKWANDFLGRLARCAAMEKTNALYARWLAAQVAEVDGWLGGLHDTLTEMLNASQQKQPQGKSGAAGGSGPVPKAPSSRNAG